MRITVQVKRNGKTPVKTYYSFYFIFLVKQHQTSQLSEWDGEKKRKGKKYNKVNDKANVVEFHGRRLKSLGTRFENTYVIACSYIDISCACANTSWRRRKNETNVKVKNITFPVCYIQDVCKKSSTKSAKTTDAYKHIHVTLYVHKYSQQQQQHC